MENVSYEIDQDQLLFIPQLLALDETMQSFNEAKAIIMDKNYDYLDQRNGQFDADYQEFTAKTDALKERIGNLIEENFANVWETPQGIKFLARFEKVSTQ